MICQPLAQNPYGIIFSDNGLEEQHMTYTEPEMITIIVTLGVGGFLGWQARKRLKK